MVNLHRRLAAPAHLLCLVIVISLATSTRVCAQTDTAPLESLSSESGSSPALDDLDYYRQHPLNLISASIADLASLPGLSNALLVRIRIYIRSHPTCTISSLCDELQLSDDAEYSLKSYTMLPRVTSANENSVLFRSRSTEVLEQQKGFVNGEVAGSALDCTQRIQAQYGEWSGGALCSKDAGESSYMDFVSAYLQCNALKGCSIIVGDFSVDAGLGTILSRGLGASKSSSSIAPCVRLGSGIRPYHSTLDYHFFRGLAAQVEMSIDSSVLQCVAFVSRLPRSANIDSVSGQVRSLDVSGLHRTSSEIQHQSTLHEQSMGVTTELRTSSWRCGAAVLGLSYDHPFANQVTSGNTNAPSWLSSIHVQFNSGNVTLLCEGARDGGARYLIASTLAIEQPTVAIALRARHIAADFQSPFGSSFGEYSPPSNEQGLYCGLMLHPDRSLRIQGYVDFFRSLTPRYGMPSPTHGTDVLCELQYQLDDKTKLTARMHNDVRSDASHASDGTLIAIQATKNSARVDCSQRVRDALNIQARLDYVRLSNDYNDQIETGVCASAQCDWTISETWRVGTRCALYSTDSFASALYSYETVAPGYVASSPLYGNGDRVLAYVQCQVLSGLVCWLRVDRTTKNNTESFSSGVTEIAGQSQSHVVFQIDCRW